MKSIIKEYFRPHIGENYAKGIAGDQYLFIGGHHYCNPAEWECDKEPQHCLEERDNNCPGYLNKPCKIREKCSEYLEAKESNNAEKCNTCKIGKFLHCETKVSINDLYQYSKLTTQEKGDNTSNGESSQSPSTNKSYRNRAEYLFLVFNKFFKKMEKLLPDSEVNKHIMNEVYELWSYVAFSNYIQHYTKLTNQYYSGEIPENELSNKDYLFENKAVLKKILLEDLKPSPSVIVVLYFDEIKEIVKEVLIKKNYLELKEYNGNKFFIFCTKESHLYKRCRYDKSERIRAKYDKLIKICKEYIETERKKYIDVKNNKKAKEIVNASIAAVCECMFAEYSIKKVISDFTEYDWLNEDTIRKKLNRNKAKRIQYPLTSKDEQPFDKISQAWEKINAE